MDFIKTAFKSINLQEDSLYDFLYNMVLYVGIKKGEEECKNGKCHTLEEFEKFTKELEAKYDT